MNTLLLALSLFFAPPLPVPPYVPEVRTEEPKRNYESLQKEAIDKNVPLIVGIRCVPIVPNGFLNCRADYLFVDDQPMIYVCLPKDGGLWGKGLPPSSSVLDVRKCIETFWNLPRAQTYTQAPRTQYILRSFNCRT